jgi:peptidoglycan hydrolase-like protein with peptidoglycan-binding domain
MRNLRSVLMAGAVAILVAFAAGTSATAAAPSSPTHATRHHRHMTSRNRIRKLQQALNAHGAKISVDGIWGPKTMAAVRRFQRLNGLKATGHVDHATMRHLMRSVG